MNLYTPQPDSRQLGKLIVAVRILYSHPPTQMREVSAHRDLYNFLRRTQGKLAADHTAEQIAAYYRELRWLRQTWAAHAESSLREDRFSKRTRHG